MRLPQHPSNVLIASTCHVMVQHGCSEGMQLSHPVMVAEGCCMVTSACASRPIGQLSALGHGQGLDWLANILKSMQRSGQTSVTAAAR